MPQINTFEDAIKASIQHYFANEEDDTPNLSKLKKRKYTKKYFDNFSKTNNIENNAKDFPDDLNQVDSNEGPPVKPSTKKPLVPNKNLPVNK